MTNPTKSTKSGNLLHWVKTAPFLESGANSLTLNMKPTTGRIAPADLRAGKGGAS